MNSSAIGIARRVEQDGGGVEKRMGWEVGTERETEREVPTMRLTQIITCVRGCVGEAWSAETCHLLWRAAQASAGSWSRF